MDWSVTYDGKPLDPRNDLYSHSPDSFSWGYFEVLAIVVDGAAGASPARAAVAASRSSRIASKTSLIRYAYPRLGLGQRRVTGVLGRATVLCDPRPA